MRLDDQQERLEASRLWFGGLFDGDGCLSLVYGRPNKRNKKKSPWIGAQIRLTNSNDIVVDEVARLLTTDGVPHHLQWRNPNIGTRRVCHVSIHGMKRGRRFLDAYKPYLRGRAREAQLFDDYITSRLAKKPGAPYTEMEVNRFLELRKLHGYRLRESPESIRRALLEGRQGRCAPVSGESQRGRQK